MKNNIHAAFLDDASIALFNPGDKDPQEAAEHEFGNEVWLVMNLQRFKAHIETCNECLEIMEAEYD